MPSRYLVIFAQNCSVCLLCFVKGILVLIFLELLYLFSPLASSFDNVVRATHIG